MGRILLDPATEEARMASLNRLQRDGKRIPTSGISWCSYWGASKRQFETIFKSFGDWQLLEESRSFTGDGTWSMGKREFGQWENGITPYC